MRVLCLVMTLLLVACSESEVPPLYGKPTKLTSNETPLLAICRIQEEFKSLPKPLMDRRSYVSGWTSRRLGAAAVRHDGYYQIHLRQEGLEFLQKHSRLELVASLTPLFTDPSVGGEAAVLLAGIPAGSKSDQGYYTRNIGNIIHRTHYASPDRSGDWFKNSAEFYGIANSLYGLTNTTEGLHRKRDPAYAQSLEQHIVDFLRAQSHAPLKHFAEGYPRVPQPHSQARLDEWVETHKAPRLTNKTQVFIHRYQGLFAGVALLPLLPYPQSTLQGNEIHMMWLLKLEEAHWPAILRVNNGLQAQQIRVQAFREAIWGKISTFCDEGRGK